MTGEPEIIELHASVEMQAALRNPRRRGYWQNVLAKRLCDEMVTRGIIDFTEQLSDGTDIYRARVRAAAPDAKAWLVERQADLAKQVADRAIKLIRQWGTDLGDTHVSKERAVEAVRQALREAT